MSFQRPIFNTGLFGRANESVCNGWTDAAEAVQLHAEGLSWAQGQIHRASTPEQWLARLVAAYLVGTNQWRYSFQAVQIDSSALPGVSDLSGTWGSTDTSSAVGAAPQNYAFNIRELYNTGTTVDAIPLPLGADVGPVGAPFSNGAFGTTGLTAVVLMHGGYASDGKAQYWFSSPNPISCQQEEQIIEA